MHITIYALAHHIPKNNNDRLGSFPWYFLCSIESVAYMEDNKEFMCRTRYKYDIEWLN